MKILRNYIRKIILEELQAKKDREMMTANYVNDALYTHSLISEGRFDRLTEERHMFNGFEIVTDRILGFCEDYVKNNDSDFFVKGSRNNLNVWKIDIPDNIFYESEYEKLFFNGLNATIILVNNPNNEWYDKVNVPGNLYNAYNTKVVDGKLYKPYFRFFCDFVDIADLKFKLKCSILHEFSHAYRDYKIRCCTDYGEDYYTKIELPKIKRLNTFDRTLDNNSSPERFALRRIFYFIFNDEKNAYLSGAYGEMEHYLSYSGKAGGVEVMNATRPIKLLNMALQSIEMLKQSDNDEEIIDVINSVYEKNFATKNQALKWIESQTKEIGLYIQKKIGLLYGRLLQQKKENSRRFGSRDFF